MPYDMSKHKDAFVSEAKSHIKNMNMGLMVLEKNPKDEKSYQQVFRSVHTLKSISGAVKYDECMNLCHAIEDLLEKMRDDKEQLGKFIDLLFLSFDFLTADIIEIENNRSELNSGDLIAKLKGINEDKLPEFPVAPEATQKLQAIEVKVERLDNLMNLTEELLVNKMLFDMLEINIDNPDFTAAVESYGRLVSDLQYHVMQIRLVPIGFVFTRFLRMTRDLAKQEKKQIMLKVEGGEIELDRMLADEIGESIAHLIRNAIDHGLETPAVRQEQGKPPAGTISLRATRTKESALIEVSDDGRGLNFDAIRDLGVKHKLIKPDATLEQVKEVIFSGLSTKDKVTEISGRGLGLAIVKQKIESIGGNFGVESSPGKGTTFNLEIPLSLAIIKTLFVVVDGFTYAVPIDSVERLLVVTQDDLKGMLDQEAIIFNDHEIPIVQLSELFDHKASRKFRQSIVIIKHNNLRLGLAVDSLLSTEEVVVKPLSPALRKTKLFSGAALIGSGEMVLILDVSYLLQIKKKIADLS